MGWKETEVTKFWFELRTTNEDLVWKETNFTKLWTWLSGAKCESRDKLKDKFRTKRYVLQIFRKKLENICNFFLQHDCSKSLKPNHKFSLQRDQISKFLPFLRNPIHQTLVSNHSQRYGLKGDQSYEMVTRRPKDEILVTITSVKKCRYIWIHFTKQIG